ncbi:MAG: hypothetical protein J0M35_20280 [Candidatus Obscuribacter phosphatis]|uniref:Uncharacterized protein n=1 Tax=Candidatus Obscuribacter phosphatis TaxID=1906157 RepID=A0A8J7PQY8_9BACT|nr:hypothetical protein [Candidatus Obscuribacter phosphatis]
MTGNATIFNITTQSAILLAILAISQTAAQGQAFLPPENKSRFLPAPSNAPNQEIVPSAEQTQEEQAVSPEGAGSTSLTSPSVPALNIVPAPNRPPLPEPPPVKLPAIAGQNPVPPLSWRVKAANLGKANSLDGNKATAILLMRSAEAIKQPLQRQLCQIENSRLETSPGGGQILLNLGEEKGIIIIKPKVLPQSLNACEIRAQIEPRNKILTLDFIQRFLESFKRTVESPPDSTTSI